MCIRDRLYVNLYDIDLSEYLKTGDISDWAKADSKPTYTADEIGAVTPYAVSYTHLDVYKRQEYNRHSKEAV